MGDFDFYASNHIKVISKRLTPLTFLSGERGVSARLIGMFY